MAVFTIADLHLSTNHETDKSMEVFGSRWRGYVDKLVKNWKAIIEPTDTVVLPGDISWAMTLPEAKADLELIHSLPGKKIIGKGNHDFWWATMAKIKNFTTEHHFESIDFLYNNAYLAENIVICGSRGWFVDETVGTIPNNTDYKKIVAREAKRLSLSLEDGNRFSSEYERVVFLHFPPVFREFRCPEIIEVLKQYHIKRCYFGHIHGSYDLPSHFEDEGIAYSLVSADFLNFVPKKLF